MQHSSRPQLQGTIRLCGDKSLSHRAIMFASLAEGVSCIRNLSRGEDVATTRRLYAELGVDCQLSEAELVISSPGFRNLKSSKHQLYCGNSGTTLRLTMGILAGSSTTCELSGDESLNKRPVKRVMVPLNLMGGELSTPYNCDMPPVILKGKQLRGIDYTSPVASAQVKSAALLAALHAESDTIYREPMKSRDHTELFLSAMGMNISVAGTKVSLTPGRELSPFDSDIPGDISTAAFLIVAALLTEGSQLRIESVLLNDTRTGAIEILKAMGGKMSIENSRIIYGEPVGDVIVSESQLKGIDTSVFPTASFIDEIPILAAAAMFASGTTVFHEISELRVKESDRAQGIVDMLSCYGCRAAINGSDLIVEGGYQGLNKGPSHHGDHRLAMAIEIIELIVNGKMNRGYENIIAISAPEFYQTVDSVLR